MAVPIRIVVLAALVANSSPSAGANIELYLDQQPPVIFIDGTLEPKDFDGFLAKSHGLKEAVVRLKSVGGSILPAMAIGREVRKLGLSTEVMEYCNSACSLIWMAGNRRYFPPGSRIGFHQPIDRNKTPSIYGIALEASYLARLGFSDEAITYAVSAAPSSLRWLTAEDAQRIGIAITPTSAPVAAVSLPRQGGKLERPTASKGGYP